ncbi:phage tail protein [Pseudovibrio ascidiaceicola]|uniref:phage tail protein n=1 Tax=Pseudovibrio ascidiaceicola TaxID=285279 RepID=UPI003D35DBA1
MPVMMRWGRFKFQVPSYSIEELKRKVESRVVNVPVVGAVAQVHTLGANPDSMTLRSTFFPHHLNKLGISQLRGVQASVRAQGPALLVHGSGKPLGLWVGRANSENESFWGTDAIPQKFTTDLELTEYVPPEDTARHDAVNLFISITI